MVLPLLAERQPYERYQSIVDRQMFGVPPAGFDPTKPPSEVSRGGGNLSAEEQKAQEQIKTAIRFSAINVTPGGQTAVGFTDSSDAKNPVHYYLKVGESRNGWTVKEADPVKATMTIVRDNVEVALAIGGDSGKSGGAAKGPAAGPRKGPGMLARKQPGASAAGSSMNSLRGRRLLRMQQRQADEAAAAAKKEEETARREEEQRREAEEKEQREAERAEQRAQLMQIQEELRRVREAREAEKAAQPDQTEDQTEE